MNVNLKQECLSRASVSNVAELLLKLCRNVEKPTRRGRTQLTGNQPRLNISGQHFTLHVMRHSMSQLKIKRFFKGVLLFVELQLVLLCCTHELDTLENMNIQRIK